MKEKGFTLIELLVVIGIIAVLSAIVLTNVYDHIKKGEKKEKEQIENGQIAPN